MATPIRHIRLDSRHWQALENYARLKGWLNKDGEGDRTKAIITFMHDNIPDECWPHEAELEGQLSLI